jgi:hypothetical protein
VIPERKIQKKGNILLFVSPLLSLSPLSSLSSLLSPLSSLLYISLLLPPSLSPIPYCSRITQTSGVSLKVSFEAAASFASASVANSTKAEPLNFFSLSRRRRVERILRGAKTEATGEGREEMRNRC